MIFMTIIHMYKSLFLKVKERLSGICFRWQKSDGMSLNKSDEWKMVQSCVIDAFVRAEVLRNYFNMEMNLFSFCFTYKHMETGGYPKGIFLK